MNSKPMSNKEICQARFKARLYHWHAEIAHFEKLAREAGADRRPGYSQQISNLHKMHAEARVKLKQLERAREDAWRDLNVGIDQASHELAIAVKKAVWRFS